jgi:branched-chain amino acid transport system ATP-binding protein
LIAIENLTVNFGGVLAIDDLCLEIEADIFGIIGPNGAGKTTLINVLSGFVEATSGRIFVLGQDLLAMTPYNRARWGLARSFQKSQVVYNLTVEDHIRVVLDFQKLSKSEKSSMVDRVLEYTHLSQYRNSLGSELNVAQRRMTEIARCLASSPRIVLLDEPGGGLSGSEVEELQSIISNIFREFDARVVLIDHDVNLIREVSSRIAVLDFGKLIACDEPSKVLNDEGVRVAYLGN